MYRVTKVRSEFVGGKFEQDIQLVAPASMTLGQKENTNTSEQTVQKTKGSDAFDIGDNFEGLGASA